MNKCTMLIVFAGMGLWILSPASGQGAPPSPPMPEMSDMVADEPVPVPPSINFEQNRRFGRGFGVRPGFRGQSKLRNEKNPDRQRPGKRFECPWADNIRQGGRFRPGTGPGVSGRGPGMNPNTCFKRPFGRQWATQGTNFDQNRRGAFGRGFDRGQRDAFRGSYDGGRRGGFGRGFANEEFRSRQNRVASDRPGRQGGRSFDEMRSPRDGNRLWRKQLRDGSCVDQRPAELRQERWQARIDNLKAQIEVLERHLNQD